MPLTERGVHALKKRYIIKTNLEARPPQKNLFVNMKFTVDLSTRLAVRVNLTA